MLVHLLPGQTDTKFIDNVHHATVCIQITLYGLRDWEIFFLSLSLLLVSSSSLPTSLDAADGVETEIIDKRDKRNLFALTYVIRVARPIMKMKFFFFTREKHFLSRKNNTRENRVRSTFSYIVRVQCPMSTARITFSIIYFFCGAGACERFHRALERYALLGS